MPVPATSAAKGYSMAGTEQGTAAGMQQLLSDTAITALPTSLTTPIPGAATAGMRLVIFAYNHTATGTITVTGTAPVSLAAVNETTTTLPIMEKPGQMAVYVTSTVFGAVNASGVTLGGGLTGGRIQIYGIQAATRLIPGITKLNDKYNEHSPNLQRGTFDMDYDLIALQKDCSWEWETDGYTDSALWLYLGGYNAAPTTTTLPAAPVAVLASTSTTSGGNASASIQPTAPGMILQCVVGGTPGTAGTVTITGTNLYGETYSETIVPSSKTAATYTSIGVFATIATNGIVWTAFGTGTPTLTVNGIFGWQVTGNPGATENSYAIEQYDSIGSFVSPYAVVTEVSWEGGANKEVKISGKGICQEVYPVGSNAVTTSQITALVQSQDRAEAGWEAVVYIDAISGTAGTTANLDVIDWKVAVSNPWQQKYTSWGNPIPIRTWNRAYRKKRYAEIELTLDMTQATFAAEYNAFRNRTKRQVHLVVQGQMMGSAGGSTWYKGWVFDLPVRWLDAVERDFNPDKESVEVKLKGRCEFDTSLGYATKITQYTQYPGVW